ncbi:MAG TPA: dienelactone hydrolase family protein [Phenylobacterium sp.]
MPEARIEIESEDGGLDAFVVCPEGPGRRAPVILLGDRQGLTPALRTRARRLAAHGYYVLAPDWTHRPADERHEDAEAWLDHLADERGVDDTRVAAVGQGAGANLAIRLAAWRAERITAVAAYGGRGFGPVTARELAQRINGVVHLGHALGVTPPRLGLLEAALTAAGVDFEVEIHEGEPDWGRLIDLLARTINPVFGESGPLTSVHLTQYNSWAT